MGENDSALVYRPYIVVDVFSFAVNSLVGDISIFVSTEELQNLLSAFSIVLTVKCVISSRVYIFSKIICYSQLGGIKKVEVVSSGACNA